MSYPLMTASAATVILAVTCPELLNAVEFTVTPPGLVVPLTNHCALAPFLKPLPFTMTSRLTVPCAAELGVAEVTVICAAARGTAKQLRMPIIKQAIVKAGCLTVLPSRRICCLVLLHGNR